MTEAAREEGAEGSEDACGSKGMMARMDAIARGPVQGSGRRLSTALQRHAAIAPRAEPAPRIP
eukprot:9846771-Alexandrium_andersonii.AAC.1